MGTEQENHPFEWLSGNGGNGPVFPIDYSQRSFAEYLGREPRQVKRYLIDHPFFGISYKSSSARIRAMENFQIVLIMPLFQSRQKVRCFLNAFMSW